MFRDKLRKAATKTNDISQLGEDKKSAMPSSIFSTHVGTQPKTNIGNTTQSDINTSTSGGVVKKPR